MRKKITFILSITIGILGGFIGSYVCLLKEIKKRIQLRELSDKHLDLVQLLDKWLMEKQHGKHLEDYFHQNRIKDVAIYGMSYIGKRLYDELKSSDIEVKYVVDKNAKDIGMDIKTFFPDEEFPEVDAIIVTAISFFDEIEEILLSKINYKVISIEDILYER